MPKVNRFRIVNFKYDNEKKYIANELFDFAGKNSLINLENGGGKSVILQLALQVLIPNAELSSRKFIDYFKINSGTAHILIEWELDSIVKEYLLTGICATRSAEGLKYFTYTHVYSGPNECDIRQIPIVDSKKQVAGYSEYLKYIREKKTKYRINDYSSDRTRDYKEKLGTFNLFQNEFDAIRVINQSEGGIEKFFENAKKSRNVIEKLIIPAIPSLFGEDQKLLADTFSKHLENLKNIPLHQDKIQTYHDFLEKGTGLLELLNEYEHNAENHGEWSKELLTLENLLVVVEARLEDSLVKLTDEKSELENLRIDIEYKIESLQIHKEKEEQESKKVLKQTQLAEQETLEENHGLKVLDWSRKKAGNLMIEYRSLKQQMMKLRDRLEVLGKNEIEIQGEYQYYLFAFRKLIEGKKLEIETSYEGTIREIARAEEAQKVLRKELETENGRSIQESNQMAVENSNIVRLEKEYNEESKRFVSKDMTLLLDLDAAKTHFEKNLEQQQSELEGLQLLLEKLRVIATDIGILLGHNSTNRGVLKERLASQIDHLENYKSKCKEVEYQVQLLGIQGNLYSGAIEGKLDALGDLKRNELADELTSKNNLENKRLLLSDINYYLPDLDLIKVIEFLEESEIASIPGALWLMQQPEEKREGLLAQNPLLVSGIVMEDSQISKLEKIGEKLSSLVKDFPIAIIPGKELGLNYEENSKAEYLYEIQGAECYLLKSENRTLYTDEKELNRYKASLNEMLEKAKENVDLKNEDYQKITATKERVTSFLEEYSLEWKEKLEKEIKEVETELRSLGTEELRLKKELQKCIEEQKLSSLRLEETKDELESTQQDRACIKKLIENRAEIKAVGIRYHLVEQKKKDIDFAIRQQIKQDLLLTDELKELGDCRRNQGQEKNHRLEQLEEVTLKLTVETPEKVIVGTYEELETRIHTIEKSFTGERKDLEGQIKDLQPLIEEKQRSFGEFGFSEADFADTYIKLGEEELLLLKEKIRQEKDEIEKRKSKIAEIQKEIERHTNFMAAYTTQVQKKYRKEPHLFSETDPVMESFYEEQIKKVVSNLSVHGNKLNELLRRKNELENQHSHVMSFIEDRKIQLPKEYRMDMLQLAGFEENINLYDMMHMKNAEIGVLFNRYKEAFDSSRDELHKKQRQVTDCFESLYGNDGWKDNDTIQRILAGIMKENLFNVVYMNEVFLKLFESVRRMKEAIELQLEQCKKNKEELVERSFHRAQTVYEEIRLVDTFSRIKIGNDKKKVIKIEMPKLDDEQGRSHMTYYIEECIQEIGKMKETNTYDPAKIDTEIRNRMSPQKLLDAAINLNEITIAVYKPERSAELSDYIPWEEVIKWSGGEKLAGFFAMFISIVSYLRYKRTSSRISSKVIWIDNPFGQANAGHLLDYIFELAKATNTQMICLTGLQETTIYAQFDVVYSLVHRMLARMSIIQSKNVKEVQMELGHFNVDNEQLGFL